MTLEATTVIRDANDTDTGFIAWVMLAASRSHLPRGIWEYINGTSEDETLGYLRRLLVTDTEHFCHLTRFLVAEVDGERAAALSGYDPDVHGMHAYMAAVPEVAASSGLGPDDFPQIMERAAVVGSVSPTNEPGAWVVEHVATAPGHRRRGLTDALLAKILDRGREQGHRIAQIAVLIGNEPARRAYLKAGFEVADEKRSDEFEAALGCPGIERLLRSI